MFADSLARLADFYPKQENLIHSTPKPAHTFSCHQRRPSLWLLTSSITVVLCKRTE